MLTCRVGSQVKFGQAKIAKLDFTLGIVEDVVWLEITVDDALGVYVGQACQSLPHYLREASHVLHQHTCCTITHVDTGGMSRLLCNHLTKSLLCVSALHKNSVVCMPAADLTCLWLSLLISRSGSKGLYDTGSFAA